MSDIPKIDASQGAGPRNIEMRFTMREVLLLHSALQHRHETLSKEAWWVEQQGDAEKATRLQEQADENYELADRVFRILDGLMGMKR